MDTLEIDFIAERNGKRVYIQTSYLLHTQNGIDREYRSRSRVSDHWPKAVVSLDDIPLPSKEGISHIQAWELDRFLSGIET